MAAELPWGLQSLTSQEVGSHLGVAPCPSLLKLRFSAAPEGRFLWSLRSVQVHVEVFRVGTLTPSRPSSWPLTGQQCGQTPQS